jgi:hypothetical protein
MKRECSPAKKAFINLVPVLWGLREMYDVPWNCAGDEQFQVLGQHTPQVSVPSSGGTRSFRTAETLMCLLTCQLLGVGPGLCP